MLVPVLNSISFIFVFLCAWTGDMGQFLYHLDPDTRKITRRFEKIKIKNNKLSVPLF